MQSSMQYGLGVLRAPVAALGLAIFRIVLRTAQ
jgi:hypothetical protein